LDIPETTHEHVHSPPKFDPQVIEGVRIPTFVTSQ